MNPFILICIQGFVESIDILVPGREEIARLSLISRRATGRVGTRYHSRGIDELWACVQLC